LNYLSIHYIGQLKDTGYYRGVLKRKTNMLLQELEKAEVEDFDPMDQKLESSGAYHHLHAVSSNLMDMFKIVVDTHPEDLTALTNIILAYSKSPEKMLELSKTILDEK